MVSVAVHLARLSRALWLHLLRCSGVQLNAAFIGVVGYALYYLCLEPVAGLSWSLCVGLPLWLTATLFQQQVRPMRDSYQLLCRVKARLQYVNIYARSCCTLYSGVVLTACKRHHAGIPCMHAHASCCCMQGKATFIKALCLNSVLRDAVPVGSARLAVGPACARALLVHADSPRSCHSGGTQAGSA